MAEDIATLISQLNIDPQVFMVFLIVALMIVGAVVVVVASRPILDV